MTAYEQLSTLERERVESDARETLYEAFRAAHCATGWCGDIMEECWGAGLPVMREALAKLVLSYRPARTEEERDHSVALKTQR